MVVLTQLFEKTMRERKDLYSEVGKNLDIVKEREQAVLFCFVLFFHELNLNCEEYTSKHWKIH